MDFLMRIASQPTEDHPHKMTIGLSETDLDTLIGELNGRGLVLMAEHLDGSPLKVVVRAETDAIHYYHVEDD